MRNKELLEGLRILPMLEKMIFHSLDTSALNLDINKTQEIILMTVRNKKNAAMCDISRRVGLEKSSYTRSVNDLVSKGYIIKNIDSKDKRKIMLELTDEGLKTAACIDKIMDNYLDRISNLFDSKEKKEIMLALGTITNFAERLAENGIGG